MLLKAGIDEASVNSLMDHVRDKSDLISTNETVQCYYDSEELVQRYLLGEGDLLLLTTKKKLTF